MPVSAHLTASTERTRSTMAFSQGSRRHSAKPREPICRRWSNAMRSPLSRILLAHFFVICAVLLQPAVAAVDTKQDADLLADLQAEAASALADASDSPEEKEDTNRHE